VAGLALGCGVVAWRQRRQREAYVVRERALQREAREEAEKLLREARLAANEEILKLRDQMEQSFAKRRFEIDAVERRLSEREGLINRQLENLMLEEKALRDQKGDLHRRLATLESAREEATRLLQQRREALARVSGLTEHQARTQLFQQVEEEALRDAAGVYRRTIDETRQRAQVEAQRILSIALQRYAGEHTFENTTAIISLENEEIKGRIIGREGRNIRAFEAATGVTVLIDDTPNAVVLSSFEPMRREIARESMQRLIVDGRIHPSRIEEVVAKVTQETQEATLRAGEEAAARVGVAPVHPEIAKLLGRLRFRHSFSQNVLEHSVEVARLMALLAAEIGLDLQLAKRAGLFHDIGKALSQEMEGAHALVGAEFLKRYGEPPEVVNGVASHHGETPPVGPWGILVSAADAISASRPGARSETMTTYLKRLGDLERIGLSFRGVDRCFAVQAGRELRVLVQPEALDDDAAFQLARQIARKVEDDLQYPGQIRVTVIRETRCVEFAK
jgi:ribonuclease Y